jgi:hypothetical protein
MKPGDLVSCVNIAPLPECRNCNLNKLTLGQVYTVKDEALYARTKGVFLIEIVNPIDAMINMEIAYDQRRFRVLMKKPDISIFKRIKDKPFVREPELV